MERAEETTQKKAAAVTPVDMSKPIWIAFYQTTAKNLYETFGTEAEAREFAAKRAEGGSTVAVFGPQKAVMLPPEKPVVQEMKLDFAEAS